MKERLISIQSGNTGDGSPCSLNFSYYCKANPRQPTNLPY